MGHDVLGECQSEWDAKKVEAGRGFKRRPAETCGWVDDGAT